MSSQRNQLGMQKDTEGSREYAFSRDDVTQFNTGPIIMDTPILGMASQPNFELETTKRNAE